MTDFASLLKALIENQVGFILIGGAAAIAHGSSRFTQDLDIVYRRSADNLLALAEALAPLHPYPRGAPPGLPFSFDQRALQIGLNFTLQTSLGSLDLLGEVPGMSTYPELLAGSSEVLVFGERVRCVDLPMLIHLKRAAGRPKDFEVIAELEALLEEGTGRAP